MNRGMNVRRSIAAACGLLMVGGALATARPAAATPSSGFHVVTPQRLFDTRVGGVPLAPLQERSIAVAGVGAVPNDATRAAVRVVFTNAVSAGQLRVHPCGAYDPAARFLLEVTRIADTGMAYPLLQAGGFCITSTVQTHVIVDLEGYESPAPGGMAFVSLPSTPTLLDRVAVDALSVTTVQVTGAAGVPAGAGAVSVELAIGGADAGFLTAYACDAPRPLVATVAHPAGAVYITNGIGALGTSGRLCIYSQAAGTVSLHIDGYWAVGATPTANGPVVFEHESVAPPGFVALTPVRAFDTRSQIVPLPTGATYELDLSARAPAEATDVVMNVTVTETGAPGFVTVYPCSEDRPLVSNLNFVAGQTVPNLVTVSLGGTASVCFYTSAPAHLLADLAGWYVAGAGDGLVSRAPARLFDTRAGAALGAQATFELDLTGRVDADASAVVMNVTVTETTAPGFVTVYPCSAGRPTASNLNFVARQTVPNLVTVAIGSDRRVCFYTSAPTHLLADLAGWYSPSSDVGYVGLVPDRLFDTREGAPLTSGETGSHGYGPGAVATAYDWVVALVMNVTAVDPLAAGFLTVFPCNAERPNASNVNYVAGQVVPNLTLVSVSPDDRACFYAHQETDVIADLAGYFTEVPFTRFVATR